ncbi:iron complex transport system permease protein [Sporobacter termitidis DSM 10068]|uniref:Iron complex transport system permease protein n=1 Tax=Sporobacter termitidis DSM 10068 TaxID=1123282 RepID=A0A1M5XC01_9FIRM|nr:iron ABC transporter permease [Sporobacter termitidis]SHH97385.1 iron complex transport system permease protein [Sporobacter termitidis DSM 10068]
MNQRKNSGAPLPELAPEAAEQLLESRENKRRTIILLVIILVPIVLFLASFVLGRFSVPLKQVCYMFVAKLFHLGQTWSEADNIVIFQVRLPRILSAVMIGGALALSGSAYQGLFKNPMVSPDILGASAGAGFGAAVALLLDFNNFGIQATAFVFGVAAVGLSYLVSKIVGRGSTSVLILVLTGLVVSTMFQAFISITKYVADPSNKLPAITFWLMGGLSTITYRELLMFLIPVVVGALPIILLRWKLNALSFGDEEARAMGINVGRLRLVIILCSTLLTAGSVAIGGIIGWVGLVIPHLARLLVGPNYKVLIPTSIVMGASYLLFVDDVARTLFSVEIPIGILTALIGAPFFIIMLLKGKRGWL